MLLKEKSSQGYVLLCNYLRVYLQGGAIYMLQWEVTSRGWFFEDLPSGFVIAFQTLRGPVF